LLLHFFPLSLAYPAALPRWWHDLKHGEARVLLPLAWSLLVIVFFSIPSGKRDVYLMPVLPMLALSLAPYLVEAADARWLRRLAFGIALLAGVAIAGVAAWALLGHSGAADAWLQRKELGDLGHYVWGMFVAMGIGFVGAALWFRPRRGVHALLAGIGALWLVWSLWAYPLLNDSSSAAGVMRHARELAGSDSEIGLVAWKEQNLLMAQGPVRDFGFRLPRDQQYAAAVRWLAEAPAHRRIFILEQAMDAAGSCLDRTKAMRVGNANRREWYLFGADAVVPGCVPNAASPAANDEDNDP